MRRNFIMRFPEGRSKALTFSYDDNVRDNVRLVEILNRHGMKGTFNLNSGLYGQNPRYMSAEEMTALFADSPHEIALHSATHPFLNQLPTGVAAYEMIKDRESLEKQFNRFVRGMAYPNNSYNDDIVSMLKTSGVVYARTTTSTKRFDIPTDWLRMPATCHHNDPELMELARKFVEKPHKYLPQLFYLWGHSYEFEDNNNWNVIEEFTEYMSGREDTVWYATNLEIYEYIEDFNRLISRVDGSALYNPTARTLWFYLNKSIYSIKPGETLYLEK